MRQSPALPGCACAEGAALARLRWVGAEGEARVATPPFRLATPPFGLATPPEGSGHAPRGARAGRRCRLGKG